MSTDYKGVCVWLDGYSLRDMFHYSTDWAQGGPIIDREALRWNKVGSLYYAWTPDHDWYDPLHEPMLDDTGVKWRGFQYGASLLIAAMRCYVASKLGETAEVPEELL